MNLLTGASLLALDKSIYYGSILAEFLFICVFMNRDRVRVHKIAKKNHAAEYPFLLIEDLVNQGFIAWPKRKLFLAQTTGFASS